MPQGRGGKSDGKDKHPSAKEQEVGQCYSRSEALLMNHINVITVL